MFKVLYIEINEEIRRELNITRDEYALLLYLHEVGKGEYVNDSKESIAQFIGITRQGLYKMMDRLIAVGLLEKDEQSALRCTAEFLSKF